MDTERESRCVSSMFPIPPIFLALNGRGGNCQPDSFQTFISADAKGTSRLTGVAANLCIRVMVPCFRVAGSPSSAGSAGAEEFREARNEWQCSSLIGAAECLRRTSRCAWLKGWGEDAVRDVFD